MKFIFAVVFAAIAVTAAGVLAGTMMAPDAGTVGIGPTTHSGARVTD
jgi:hypothetical protein